MKSSPQKLIRHERLIRSVSVVGLLLIILVVLLAVENMLISFVLAFVIFYLFVPFVDYLERRGMSRQLATIIPFGVSGAFLAVATQVFAPTLMRQMNRLQVEFPKYIEGTTSIVQSTENQINAVVGSVYEVHLTSRVQPLMVSWATELFQELPNLISQSLTTLFLAPFFAFFLLLDGNELSRKLVALVPNNYFELVLNLNHQIGSQMGGFIRARLLEGLIVGAVVWLGLFLMGFPYAPLLAVFAGVLNLIPYIGPLIGALPAMVLALINGGPGTELLLVGLVYIVAQLIDALFIIPLVVAKIVNLHPVTVVVVLIIGAQLMGIVGMLISIPVMSMLKVTSTAFYRHLTEFRY